MIKNDDVVFRNDNAFRKFSFDANEEPYEASIDIYTCSFGFDFDAVMWIPIWKL